MSDIVSNANQSETVVDLPQGRTGAFSKRDQIRRARAVAANLQAGDTIKDAMVKAGYSEGQASRGIAAVPDRVWRLLGKDSKQLAARGAALTVETLKNLAMGRMADNLVEGKDKAAMTLKLAGSHRDLNLWTPDSQVGVVILNSPQLPKNPLDTESTE